VWLFESKISFKRNSDHVFFSCLIFNVRQNYLRLFTQQNDRISLWTFGRHCSRSQTRRGQSKRIHLFQFTTSCLVSKSLLLYIRKKELDGSSRFVIATYDRMKSTDFAFFVWAEPLAMVVPRPGEEPRIFAFVYPFQSTVTRFVFMIHLPAIRWVILIMFRTGVATHLHCRLHRCCLHDNVFGNLLEILFISWSWRCKPHHKFYDFWADHILHDLHDQHSDKSR
jgi:hypothetical protein